MNNLIINCKYYHHLGRSQICAGAGYYFSPSKPHSRTLCVGFLQCISVLHAGVSQMRDFIQRWCRALAHQGGRKSFVITTKMYGVQEAFKGCLLEQAITVKLIICKRKSFLSFLYSRTRTQHRMVSNLVLIYFSYYGARGRKSLISPCQIFHGIVK